MAENQLLTIHFSGLIEAQQCLRGMLWRPAAEFIDGPRFACAIGVDAP